MRGISAAMYLLFVLVPRVLTAQTPVGEQAPPTADDNRPQRLSLHVAGGVTVPHGGQSRWTLQSVSIGYSPTPKLTVLVSGGRPHSLTHVQHFPDGGSGATRGGTVLFVGGEMRFALRSGERVFPYAMAGAGVGISRPNVNEVFTDPVTNTAQVFFSGGGLAVPLGRHLLLSGDAGFFLVSERDVIGLILPIRGSVAWRF